MSLPTVLVNKDCFCKFFALSASFDCFPEPPNDDISGGYEGGRRALANDNILSGVWIYVVIAVVIALLLDVEERYFVCA